MNNIWIERTQIKIKHFEEKIIKYEKKLEAAIKKNMVESKITFYKYMIKSFRKSLKIERAYFEKIKMK